MRMTSTRFEILALATLLAIALLSGCNQAQQPTPAGTPGPTTTGEKVYVEFEGPWAFAPDPKDNNSILAIAPNTKGHRPLYVKASNEAVLQPGTYDLSVPSPTGKATGAADPNIAQAKISAANLEHAIGAKTQRYVIRLPRPEAYVVAGRYRSRLGPTYPPDVTTEKDYAVAVSLRYSVANLNGFSLSGTPDTASFNPLLLQVETPVVRFAIEPSQMDDPLDKCETHSRESFRDLVKLLGLTLYVDYPDSPADCHKKDPQLQHAAELLPFSRRPGRDMVSLEASVVLSPAKYLEDFLYAGTLLRNVAAAFFFNMPAGNCKAPVLMLTVG